MQLVRQGEAGRLGSQLAAEFAGIEDGPEHGSAPGSVPEAMYCLAAAEIAAHLEVDFPGPGTNDKAAGTDSSQADRAYHAFFEFAQWYAGAIRGKSQ